MSATAIFLTLAMLKAQSDVTAAQIRQLAERIGGGR